MARRRRPCRADTASTQRSSRRAPWPRRDRADLVEQPRQVVQAEHVRPVRQRAAVLERAVGILVNLHEQGVHPHRDRGAGEGLHVLALAARPVPLPARQLHRVGRVEDHRIAEAAHDRKPAEIDHQVVVSEARAALGEEQVLAAGPAHLLHHVDHVPRGHELPLLDVHRPAAPRARHDQVGLQAEERGHLQHVEHRGRRRDHPDFVDVGQHRQPGLVLDLLEDAEPLHQPGPPVRVDRRTVGLVVRRLVDEGHPRGRGHPLQALGHHQRVLVVLDGARPPDQGQRRAAPDGDGPDPDRPRRGHAPPWRSSAALMKAAKRGCGSQGRERNSGWNCPATNHG